MYDLKMRDHNGECLNCDEHGAHAPDCRGLQELLARLRTDALCIQPEFCAATRRQAAEELEILMLALKD
jgi:hypothetical protein